MQSTAEHDMTAGDVGQWLAFWVPLAVLAFLFVWGAFYASADVEPGDYACGLILSLASLVLAFMRIKSRFDGRSARWGDFLLVDDIPNLFAAIVVLVIVALAGLIIAAATDYGGLHDGGVALFVTSGIAIFLSMKHVFDNLARDR